MNNQSGHGKITLFCNRDVRADSVFLNKLFMRFCIGDRGTVFRFTYSYFGVAILGYRSMYLEPLLYFCFVMDSPVREITYQFYDNIPTRFLIEFGFYNWIFDDLPRVWAGWHRFDSLHGLFWYFINSEWLRFIPEGGLSLVALSAKTHCQAIFDAMQCSVATVRLSKLVRYYLWLHHYLTSAVVATWCISSISKIDNAMLSKENNEIDISDCKAIK